MHEQQIGTIVSKMTKMEEMLSKIQIQLAGLNHSESSHKDNIKELVVRTNENRTKIVELELKVTAINTKLMIFGVIATIIIPIISGFLMKVLFHLKM